MLRHLGHCRVAKKKMLFLIEAKNKRGKETEGKELKRNKIVALLLAGGIAVTPLQSVVAQVIRDGNDMTVHFVDVGQGLGILVRSGDETLVYDGGPASNADLFSAYLQEQGVKQIDYMIASHYDADHIGGLLEALELFDVENVIGPTYEHDSNLYRNFLSAVSEEGIEIYHPEVGDMFEFGSGRFTVLSPDGVYPNDSNKNSVVVKLENGDDSFMFTGDAEEDSEQKMLGMDLDCDVLCVGHHGSSYSTSWEFLSATDPECAVVSCGRENTYGHPHDETIEKLHYMDISIYRTDKQGTIVAYSTGKEISWDEEAFEETSSGRFEDKNKEIAEADKNEIIKEWRLIVQKRDIAGKWVVLAMLALTGVIACYKRK